MENKKYKIAGVVILYHPDNNFLKNIESYINDIDILFAIDNTEIPSPKIKEQLANKKIVYRAYNENLGVAKALNDAALLAIEENCDFLLTMDQDSKATPKLIPNMLACLSEENIQQIGIIAPQHIMSNLKEKAGNGEKYKELLTTMTSGNLLKLSVFSKIGPFTEELFIDAVDLDYCLRLNEQGFKVIEVQNAKLIHQLGSLRSHNFLGRKIFTSHHSALRRYYISRNFLYVNRKYKKQFAQFCRRLVINVICAPLLIALFEENKIGKIKMIASGVIDYKRGVYGKYVLK